jgi:hypothetical protein
MTPPIARHAALVLATEADVPTQVCFPAAVQVNGLLSAAGYAVAAQLPYLPPTTPPNLNPHLASVFAQHLTATGASGFSLAYFSAHGASRLVPDPNDPTRPGTLEGYGLCALLPPRQVFMGFRPGATRHPLGHFFRSAVLVINACLHNGQLPQLLVSRPNEVRAVIGYRERLLCCSDAFCLHELGTALTPVYQTMYRDALVRPIRSLLAGRTPAEALLDTHTCWSDLARQVQAWNLGCVDVPCPIWHNDLG